MEICYLLGQYNISIYISIIGKGKNILCANKLWLEFRGMDEFH